MSAVPLSHLKQKYRLDIKELIKIDLKKIRSKQKNFSNLNFLKIPNIMGILNITPDHLNRYNNNFKDYIISKKRGITSLIFYLKLG